jgi:hypothetical protein
MGTAILFACSSEEATPVATPVDSSSGIDSTPMRREIGPEEEDPLEDAAPLCAPRPLAMQPKWHPSKPINRTACTAKQAADFLTACLAGSRAACDGFRTQNPGCAACAYSSSEDPSWGPLVSYRDKSYAEVNHGGCIALSVGEPDETKCGGSFQLYDQCALAACDTCLPINTKNTVANVGKCLEDPKVLQICATWIDQGKVECPTVIGAAAALRCSLGKNTFEQNALRYVSFWCTNADDLDAGDGGDAADAADD